MPANKGKITSSQISQSVIDYISKNIKSTFIIKKGTTTITTPSDNININLEVYNKDNDFMIVFRNTVFMEDDEYTISTDSKKLILPSVFEASIEEPITFNFICFKNIPTGSTFDGRLLNDNSVDETKLSTSVTDKLNNSKSNITILSTGWIQNATTQFWEYRLYDSDITTSATVEINVQIPYVAIAKDLQSLNQTFNGYVQLYSYSKPTGNIIVDIRLSK